MTELASRDQMISRITRTVGQLIWLGNKRFAQLCASYGLTVPQYFTLFFLWHQGEACSMHALAELTHQDAATLTGIVDRLIRLGYVSRQRGEDDRRKVYVTLEPAGRQVVRDVRDGRHENWRHSFEALSHHDLREMIRLLETILYAWQFPPAEERAGE